MLRLRVRPDIQPHDGGLAMRFLVLQHIPVEHPGILRDFWKDYGISWDVAELDEGDPIPTSLSSYDALISMGGPMDVWQEDLYPWLKDEKDAIREWVSKGERPFLGICLGHQLLAEAIGGTVGPMHDPEVGIVRVSHTSSAIRDPIMRSFPSTFDCFQWHSAEVKDLPPGAEVIASNQQCRIQAIRWGAAAYGFQYHVELTESTVSDWAQVPAYKESLEAVMGPDACPRLETTVAQKLPEFNATASRLNDQFLSLVRASIGEDPRLSS